MKRDAKVYCCSKYVAVICCLFFVTDMVIGDTTHTDNKSSLERGGEIALAKSVKIGTLRAEEEIAIDADLGAANAKYIHCLSY
ncbi:hypothetical protein [Bacillus thuringiensis]|uniref:hypothetical protein n=1 Tax=Bacillus thuringiensis TaxID=1428 RepID=UPI003D6D770F